VPVAASRAPQLAATTLGAVPEEGVSLATSPKRMRERASRFRGLSYSSIRSASATTVAFTPSFLISMEKPLPASTSNDAVMVSHLGSGMPGSVAEPIPPAPAPTHLPSVASVNWVKAAFWLEGATLRSADVAEKVGASVMETFHMAEKSPSTPFLQRRPM